MIKLVHVSFPSESITKILLENYCFLYFISNNIEERIMNNMILKYYTFIFIYMNIYTYKLIYSYLV